MLRPLTLFCTLAVFTFGLSGCLLDRIQAVQQQACDPEENFLFSSEGGIRLDFLNPVLRYDDIVFLVGIEPRSESELQGILRASYLLRLHRSDAEELENIELVFSGPRNRRLLRSVRINSELPVTVSREEFLLMAEDTCSTALSPWNTRLERPIPAYVKSMLPSRTALIELVGMPTHYSDNGRELDYDYVLEGARQERLSGSVYLLFDDSGERLLKTRSTFSHYVSEADFERGVERLSLAF